MHKERGDNSLSVFFLEYLVALVMFLHLHCDLIDGGLELGRHLLPSFFLLFSPLLALLLGKEVRNEVRMTSRVFLDSKLFNSLRVFLHQQIFSNVLCPTMIVARHTSHPQWLLGLKKTVENDK